MAKGLGRVNLAASDFHYVIFANINLDAQLLILLTYCLCTVTLLVAQTLRADDYALALG